MSEKIKFKIVTPERVVYEEEIDQLTLPTKQGEITILPDHIPLVSSLSAGELRVKKGEEIVPMAISGGFLEVQGRNQVVVLADTAERAVEIDEARAEEARRKAEELRREKIGEAEGFAMLSAKIEKELARLRVKRKHRDHHSHLGLKIEE